VTRNENTFWKLKWTKESPHTAYFDGVTFEKPGRGGRRKDFKVFGLLGEGAFGRVLLAKKKSTGGHSSSEEVLALKFVPNKRVSDFEKEVLFRVVGHPFMVQLLTFFQTNESLCYVMEYIEGGNLRSLCSRLKKFN
jgi:serine/threonine protein kinase